MKFTTVSIKEIQADKTHRLDAKYWIKKKHERKIMTEAEESNTYQLKRIADILEEILRLVKKDMEPEKKK